MLSRGRGKLAGNEICKTISAVTHYFNRLGSLLNLYQSLETDKQNCFCVRGSELPICRSNLFEHAQLELRIVLDF